MGYLIARTFHRPDPGGVVSFLFAGEEGGIPQGRFRFLLPNRREWARRNSRFLGYILPFSPSKLSDRKVVRRRLGYGDEPLIVCSIGGKAIGKYLLGLCGKTFPLLEPKLPGVCMILVCGFRLVPDSLEVPAGVELRGYVPSLCEHFGGSDLAIVQGGGTTTIELTALGRPFHYFAVENHFEQEIHVAGRQRRLAVGIKLLFSETTPESVAGQVLSQIGEDVTYARMRIDGAKAATQIIVRVFDV